MIRRDIFLIFTATCGITIAARADELLPLRPGMVPMTRGCRKPAPACPVRVLREPRPVRRGHVLKLACTERGQCAAVVLRREG